MEAHLWEDELQLKAIWALLAFAPSYAVQIGEKGGIRALTLCMYKNKTNHDIQVGAIKLLSLLTIEPTLTNLQRARDANAARIVKTVIQAHIEDGTLQFRGINLLERLEPGCTSEMPKVNLIRSASMRAEEMVMNTRSVARIASSRGMSMKEMVSGRREDPEAAARNAAAIAEVDELAHQVDDESSDDESHRTRSAASSAVNAVNTQTSSRATTQSGHLPGAVDTPSRHQSHNGLVEGGQKRASPN
jgi:hypothetical protein